jgi:DNA-damage-inducible protein D
MSQPITPFETIRRTNPAGNESWSSRDFARVLGYVNYRHFQAVIEKARTACSNSEQPVEDHFVGADQMVEIGSGAQRPLKTVMMSRYACYLVIQNADPSKEIVAQGQTYFAIQTRRQELSDAEIINTLLKHQPLFCSLLTDHSALFILFISAFQFFSFQLLPHPPSTTSQSPKCEPCLPPAA